MRGVGEVVIGLILGFVIGVLVISEIHNRKLDRVEQALKDARKENAVWMMKADSLNHVISSIKSDRERNEKILDSLRRVPLPRIDTIRSAGAEWLERYFDERYESGLPDDSASQMGGD